MEREYKKQGFFSFSDSRNRELWCLKQGESEINTVCRVLEVSRKEIWTRAEGDKVIINGIIADDTAKLPFVSWEEREKLVKDKVVLIENAYVRKWKGLTTLYIGKNTKIIERDIDFPSRSELVKPKMRTIANIVGCEGAFDVIVAGDIVFSEGENKRVLDDGTGALFLDVLREKGEDFGFGMPVKARGNVVESERGYVLMAEEAKIKGEVSVMAEIKNFLCRYT
jgi:ssDNA-binding replication factor A large subunit